MYCLNHVLVFLTIFEDIGIFLNVTFFKRPILFTWIFTLAMCVLYFEVFNQLDRFYTTLSLSKQHSKGTHIRGLATYQS